MRAKMPIEERLARMGTLKERLEKELLPYKSPDELARIAEEADVNYFFTQALEAIKKAEQYHGRRCMYGVPYDCLATRADYYLKAISSFKQLYESSSALPGDIRETMRDFYMTAFKFFIEKEPYESTQAMHFPPNPSPIIYAVHEAAVAKDAKNAIMVVEIAREQFGLQLCDEAVIEKLKWTVINAENKRNEHSREYQTKVEW